MKLSISLLSLVCCFFVSCLGQAQDVLKIEDGIQDAPDEALEMEIKDKQIAALTSQVVELENELIYRDLEAKRDQELFRRQIFEELAHLKSAFQEIKSSSDGQKSDTDHTADQSALIQELKNQLNATQEEVKELKMKISDTSRVDQIEHVVKEMDQHVGGSIQTLALHVANLEVKTLFPDDHIEASPAMFPDAERQTSVDQIKTRDQALQAAWEAAVEGQTNKLDHWAPYGSAPAYDSYAVAVCSPSVNIKTDAGRKECMKCFTDLKKKFDDTFGQNHLGGRVRDAAGRCKFRFEQYVFHQYDV